MSLAVGIPCAWRECLADEFEKTYFRRLSDFVLEERRTQTVFPEPSLTFSALSMVSPDAVRVVVLGQDPYHDDGQAHGLAFSVSPGVKPPPSLRNIFKERLRDLGVEPPDHGCLTAWAKQGVLLLNTVLTVRAHQAHSHKGQGWEEFTDSVIRAVNAGPERVVFLLWGTAAQQKATWIDTRRHAVFPAAHPSPLSAYRGFFGSRPFSHANAALRSFGRDPVDWHLPGKGPVQGTLALDI